MPPRVYHFIAEHLENLELTCDSGSTYDLEILRHGIMRHVNYAIEHFDYDEGLDGLNDDEEVDLDDMTFEELLDDEPEEPPLRSQEDILFQFIGYLYILASWEENPLIKTNLSGLADCLTAAYENPSQGLKAVNQR